MTVTLDISPKHGEIVNVRSVDGPARRLKATEAAVIWRHAMPVPGGLVSRTSALSACSSSRMPSGWCSNTRGTLWFFFELSTGR